MNTQPQILDAGKKQNVEYCIPIWLRDAQVHAAVKRGLPTIQPFDGLRDEPVAVVCYGPSLADTWKEIRKFKHVITCSGAHRFLTARGVTPSWHVEVDPRKHKVELIGRPRKKTQYLIASTCHAAVFDHLKDFDVLLWHVFDNGEQGLRELPAGEWLITGGSSVGLRALTLARFLGFTDLHVFGMDGCEGKTGKHAAAHPNQPQGHSITVVGGQEYRTTPSLLECARQTFHELDQMSDVKATFHGEGLVQAMAKTYVPSHKKGQPEVGIMKPELISAEYKRLNEQLHESNLAYGVGGAKHADTIMKLLAKVPSLKSVGDYGCGKGLLAKALPFPIWEYDPAVPGKDAPLRPCDLVVCTDVLEHIEPDKLLFVMGDLKRCVKQIGFFVIHMGPSQKKLADGRNAHLLQWDEEKWNRALSQFFDVSFMKVAAPNLVVLVSPKKGGA